MPQNCHTLSLNLTKYHENISICKINKKINKVIYHQIEDYNKIRSKYPYEDFMREELPNLESNFKKEYQQFYKTA